MRLSSSTVSRCNSRKATCPDRGGRPQAASLLARTGASRRRRPDARLAHPKEKISEATYRPPPSSAHPRLRRRRRSFRAILVAARSWRTSDDAKRNSGPAAKRDSANRGGSSLQGRRLQAYQPARDKAPATTRGQAAPRLLMTVGQLGHDRALRGPPTMCASLKAYSGSRPSRRVRARESRFERLIAGAARIRQAAARMRLAAVSLLSRALVIRSRSSGDLDCCKQRKLQQGIPFWIPCFRASPFRSSLRPVGFAQATPRQCVGKRILPQETAATSIYDTKPSHWFFGEMS